ncbi:hypothetical protein [Novosphingobium sp.]|uniref:hypothetical protein n=1 Tax=Novosphingobium sp. TaxID=1874826 RepID=UPI00286CB364|nr:hypothetical protein [Novosphingobium sp.]
MDVSGGFYTLTEAARLLGMESGRRVVNWLEPTRSGGAPVIERDYQRVGPVHEVSFLDLIEIRFVEHFRRTKISLQSLRVAAETARAELGVSHPFATCTAKFQTDRKQIFLETAEETGDLRLLNLMTKQVEMYDIIESIFARDLEFTVAGLAKKWVPVPNIAPNVMVSPLHAFGRPVISDRFIPTRTLFEFWIANERQSAEVADWFDVDESEVDEAIRFELRPLH